LLKNVSGQVVGCFIGRDAFTVTGLINPQNHVVDSLHTLLHFGLGPAGHIDAAAENSASIDHIVGGIKDISCFELLPVFSAEQLIICRAANDLNFELVYGVVVQNSAKRTGSKYVSVGLVDHFGINNSSAEFLRASSG